MAISRDRQLYIKSILASTSLKTKKDIFFQIIMGLKTEQTQSFELEIQEKFE